MTFTAVKNIPASDAHKVDVWDYVCDSCGEVADSNARFDKEPDVNYCSNCGADLFPKIKLGVRK